MNARFGISFIVSASILVFGIGRLYSTIPTHTLSTGAPPSSTGAPGEQNCTRAGCHDDVAANPTGTSIETAIKLNTTRYAPGKEYELSVSISAPGHHRFGFQVVALDSLGRNVGSFGLIDPSRTQILQNLNELLDRRYATYTYNGTEELSDGVGEWNLRWTAPEATVGTVHFYAALLAANNDRTDKGDSVFTLVRSIAAETTSCIEDITESTLGFQPHPVNDFLSFDKLSSVSSLKGLEIFDLNGQLRLSIDKPEANTKIDISSLSAGAYVAVVRYAEHLCRIPFVKN